MGCALRITPLIPSRRRRRRIEGRLASGIWCVVCHIHGRYGDSFQRGDARTGGADVQPDRPCLWRAAPGDPGRADLRRGDRPPARRALAGRPARHLADAGQGGRGPARPGGAGRGGAEEGRLHRPQDARRDPPDHHRLGGAREHGGAGARRRSRPTARSRRWNGWSPITRPATRAPGSTSTPRPISASTRRSWRPGTAPC